MVTHNDDEPSLETSEEKVTPKLTPPYNVGDLVYSSDKALVGFIIDFVPGFTNKYKIDFKACNAYNTALADLWKGLWWKETAIRARVLSKKWIVQKKGT